MFGAAYFGQIYPAGVPFTPSGGGGSSTFAVSDHVLHDVGCVINGTDLSQYLVGVTVTIGKDESDVTPIGSPSHVYRPLLETGSAELTFRQDYATVDGTLWPLLSSTGFPVTIRPSAATPVTFSGTFQVSQYQPAAARVGDAQLVQLSLLANSNVTRTP